jgi:hypothetical protein
LLSATLPTGHYSTARAAEPALSALAARGAARDLSLINVDSFVKSATWMDVPLKYSEHFFNHWHYVDYAIIQAGAFARSLSAQLELTSPISAQLKLTLSPL